MPIRTPALAHLTFGALLAGATLGAHAANLGFLRDTPITYMKTRDIDSIKAAAVKALNAVEDGQSAAWSNDGLGNSVKIDATIALANTQKDGDRTCRDETVILNAKGQSMTLRPQFCKQGSGAWQLQKK